MRARRAAGIVRRIGVLVVVVTAAAVFAEASAAAVPKPDGVAAGSAATVNGCAGPCPVPVLNKGNGSGRVTSTQAGLFYECRPSPVCDFTVDDSPGAGPAILRAIADEGSVRTEPLWEGCPRILDNGDCELWPTGIVTICVTFVSRTSPSAASGCPPPPENIPPPAPPAPTGPPPLGARCTIPGSPGADVIRGTAGRDVICGNGGNDRIYGGGGHDLLVGGRGDDKLYGQAGRDRLAGGAGADLLVGGGADDELLGGSGADLLSARDGIRERVNGGSGRDRARVDRSDRVRAVERRL